MSSLKATEQFRKALLFYFKWSAPYHLLLSVSSSKMHFGSRFTGSKNDLFGFYYKQISACEDIWISSDIVF